jgi:hypothetical protein
MCVGHGGWCGTRTPDRQSLALARTAAVPAVTVTEGVAMVEDYWRAFYAARLRRHAGRWSWSRMRIVCACGGPVPCPHRKAIMAQAMGRQP